MELALIGQVGLDFDDNLMNMLMAVEWGEDKKNDNDLGTILRRT